MKRIDPPRVTRDKITWGKPGEHGKSTRAQLGIPADAYWPERIFVDNVEFACVGTDNTGNVVEYSSEWGPGRPSGNAVRFDVSR